MYKNASANTIYLKDYRPSAFLIESIDLYFDLREKTTTVRSRLVMRRHAEADRSESLWLDGEELKLLAISIDGKALSDDQYLLENSGLRIHSLPDRFVLETEVELAPQNNTALEGLYLSNGLYCTQCEAQGFRRITYYIDRPDVMARFSTTIEADAGQFPVLLSNGNPQGLEALPQGRCRITWEDPFLKPAYLFALVAGDLALLEDRFTTSSGREIALRIYSEPHNIGKCGFAMHSLKQAMRWDEEHYGREYDLDIFMIVAVNDFNMGAMENKGLNIFNAKLLLADPATATDRDYQAIEGVVAHEYFHNWTGNRITCRDWFQLSLKEGLTVYRDQEFSADMGSRSVKRIQDVRMLRAHQFAEDASPMAHPVRPDSYIEINNFYTLTVYEKGAEVVRMQANLLGPEGYRRATDLYFERHDGGAVTTDDFVSCMQDSSGRDLSLFKRWYSQAGTPQLHVTTSYDQHSGGYEMKVVQSCPPTPGQPHKQPLHIPFAIGLMNAEGEDLPVTLQGEQPQQVATRVLELRETEAVFHFSGLYHKPVPSLLRGFSAPVKLVYDYSNDELMFLMAHDSDGFSRWDAAQMLHLRVLLQRVADANSALPDGYLDAVRKALLDKKSDPELLSEVLLLPSESYIGDQMEIVAVDAVHYAREALMTEIAAALRSEFMEVHAHNVQHGDYDTSHASIARRALRNLSLAYLSHLDDAEVRQLILDQYAMQHNMTDVMAALSLVVHRGWSESAGLLADFEQRWKSEQLVMDKWFSVQASSAGGKTLERVTSLMQHPAFNMGNPNRVRSLIGVFAGANQVQFHRADGEGYQLLAEVVLQLDHSNPLLAARLIRQMSRWRRFDAQRQQLMKHQLQRILAAEGLSKDVREVVSLSLQS
ncbi:MAG: aminopeptidase N [Gammaproteobacteria bacterium]|nr:aminopeptidase N [Gammaproteobacteria bacterium]